MIFGHFSGFHEVQFFFARIRVPDLFLLAGMLVLHSSSCLPGVNQVDGLPPALSLDF